MIKYLCSLLLVLSLPVVCQAQAPATLTTCAAWFTATDGTNPFAASGSYLYVGAKKGLQYRIIGFGLNNSSGSYTYSAAPAPAVLQLSDSVLGPVDTQLYFTATNQGIYSAESPIFGGFQDGIFDVYSVAVPTKLTGQSAAVSIIAGSDSYATNGTYLISLTASNYTILGSGSIKNSSGSYSYAVTNPAVGELTLNDSVIGGEKAYFVFQNSYSGLFLAKKDSAYQIGNFMLLTTTKPTVKILNLTAGQTVKSFTYTVKGNASDKILVNKVYYSLNGSNWQLASGTTGWSANVNLTVGKNAFSVYALDSSGNLSTVSTVKFTCKP